MPAGKSKKVSLIAAVVIVVIIVSVLIAALRPAPPPVTILFLGVSDSVYDPTHSWSAGSNGFSEGRFVRMRMQYDTNAHIIDSFLSPLQVKVGDVWQTNTADNPRLRIYYMGGLVVPATCRVPSEAGKVRVTLNYWKPRWTPFGIGREFRLNNKRDNRGQRALYFISPSFYNWLCWKVRRSALQTATAEFDLPSSIPSTRRISSRDTRGTPVEFSPRQSE